MEINKIYCGDALKILKDFPDEFVNCIITSPPYKNAYMGIGISKGKKVARFHYENDVGEPLYLIEDIAVELFRVLKKRGIFFLNLGFNKDTGALRPFYIAQRLLKRGWFCPETIIWHKNNPIPNTANQLTNSYEYIFLFTKRPFYNFPSKERKYIHNVWKFPISSGDSIHNATFPIKLPLNCISLFTNPRDLILDPFVGIGTTAIATKMLDRNYIGIDINPKYVKIAEEKLNVKR